MCTAPGAQEEYIKEEQRSLKRELLRAQEEVKRIQSVPLVIGQFLEMVDGSSGIVGSTTGSNYYVRILSTLNRRARMHDACAVTCCCWGGSLPASAGTKPLHAQQARAHAVFAAASCCCWGACVPAGAAHGCACSCVVLGGTLVPAMRSVWWDSICGRAFCLYLAQAAFPAH